MRTQQLNFLKKMKSSYGGTLMTKRKGRLGPRPIATRHTMHLVLRSTKAKGELSFLASKNKRVVEAIVSKFAKKYGVQINKFANVGNHLHLWFKLGNRHAYKPFIRALTAAIAMAVTGRSRWNRGDGTRFWDRRPFSRIIDCGFRAVQTISDYLRINQLEGSGFARDVARIIVSKEFSSG